VKIENEFTVSAPVEEAWAVVLDLERIAPCLPGAAIQESTGENEYAGTMKVKIGPITASYKGTVKFEEIDESNHRAVLNATGRDPRGGGTASATIVSTMQEEDGKTKVSVETDMKLTGRAAQFGRGIAQDVAAKMLGRFAACLEEEITGNGTEADVTATGEESRPTETAQEGTVSAPPAAVTGGPAASPVDGSPADGSLAAARPGEPVVEGEAKVQGAVIVGQSPSEARMGASDTANPQGRPQAEIPRREDAPSSGTPREEPEPLDLAEVGGAALLKRLLPLVAGAAVLTVLVVWLARRRR
jgi:carbon monoxide dehydrogenase subunit G